MPFSFTGLQTGVAGAASNQEKRWGVRTGGQKKRAAQPVPVAQPISAAEPTECLAHPVANAMMMMIEVANLVGCECAQRRSENGGEGGDHGDGFECFHVVVSNH
jgi:hypothetical protein